MVNVVFNEKSNKLVSFKVLGHADYAEFSKDIVCSSVSVVAQTTILGVVEVLKMQAFYLAKEADIQLDLGKLTEIEIEKCQVLMKTMLLGLKNIEISYGKYIKVTVEEV